MRAAYTCRRYVFAIKDGAELLKVAPNVRSRRREASFPSAGCGVPCEQSPDAMCCSCRHVLIAI
jgi:hypothetical protein